MSGDLGLENGPGSNEWQRVSIFLIFPGVAWLLFFFILSLLLSLIFFLCSRSSVLRIFIHVFLVLTAFGFWWTFASMVVMDILHPAGGVILTFAWLFGTWWLISPPSVFALESGDGPSCLTKPISHVVGFVVAFILIFLICFLPIFFLEDVCYCEHPAEFNTRYTRSSICNSKSQVPCFVYLTVPENGQLQMNVNFQFGIDTQNDGWVYYDTFSLPDNAPVSSYRFKKKAFSISQTHQEGDRWIHWAELNGLTPNTTYYFRAGFGSSNDNYSKEKKFRTLPNHTIFNFASGGDMGVTDAAKKLLQVIGKRKDISFIFIGGDLSYAPTGASACRGRWDKWLQMINDYAVDANGFVLPLVLAIGNHDAVDKSTPFFLTWFPLQQNYSSSMNPVDRRTFHSHVVSNNTIIICLDSGHVVSIDSQVDWLKGQLSLPYANRIPAYHVPMYPGWRDPNGPRQNLMKQHWMPLFDQNKLKLVFEHHDHMYKRTKKLTGDKTNSNGTLYLGDGCMGVAPRTGASLDRFYLEAIRETEHFYFVYVNGTSFSIEPVDQNGLIFDQFALP